MTVKGIIHQGDKYINIETGEEVEMKEASIDGIGVIRYVEVEREVFCRNCLGTGLIEEVECEDCSGSGAYMESLTPIMIASEDEEILKGNLPKGWDGLIGGEE
jgi:DnaJ-class molecular chaperone